ncbi:MAG: alpha/beta hydrolase-fold protein [Myxococcales bacterium]
MAHFALQRARSVDTRVGKLSYLIHEPPGFANDLRPGLLFLHGSGERGQDLRLLTNTAIPALIERGKNLPFVTISPQCPAGVSWRTMLAGLSDLLDQVVPEAAINSERLYLTGISMGGYGAWQLAAEQPERFAALAPLCGGGDPAWAARLKGLPTWAFHGAKDTVVLPSESKRMVEALERVGAPVKYTLYDDLAHDCWTRAYDDPELYSWMLGIKQTARAQGSAAAQATPTP